MPRAAAATVMLAITALTLVTLGRAPRAVVLQPRDLQSPTVLTLESGFDA